MVSHGVDPSPSRNIGPTWVLPGGHSPWALSRWPSRAQGFAPWHIVPFRDAGNEARPWVCACIFLQLLRVLWTMTEGTNHAGNRFQKHPLSGSRLIGSKRKICFYQLLLYWIKLLPILFCSDCSGFQIIWFGERRGASPNIDSWYFMLLGPLFGRQSW